ncbi:RHS repeat-associated core domain-containing protein [Arthrobacter sp. YA7-1]|uniref:RHS repeat-associated core domain-containing protein n=1 Tax=Arthrobacter sp. YA7-1 TaxID=2987701 RepID=UPI0039B52725
MGSLSPTWAQQKQFPSGFPAHTCTTGTPDRLHTTTSWNPFEWNGQNQDTDTGLYYLRARYYDPQTTQFISIDPASSLTNAIYSYASHNPLNLLDPLGLWDDSDTQSVFGVVLGGLGVAAGVAALVVAAPEIAIGLAAGAFALGVGAAFLDGPACFGKGEMLACAGFALGVQALYSVGVVLGSGGRIRDFGRRTRNLWRRARRWRIRPRSLWAGQACQGRSIERTCWKGSMRCLARNAKTTSPHGSRGWVRKQPVSPTTSESSRR